MTPPYALVNELGKIRIIPVESFESAKQLARKMSDKNMTYYAKYISEEEARKIREESE